MLNASCPIEPGMKNGRTTKADPRHKDRGTGNEYNTSLNRSREQHYRTPTSFIASSASVNEFNFSHIHTFKYSVRKGTRAERLENHLPEKVKNERSLLVRNLSVENKMNYFKSLIGQQQDVLIEKVTQGIARGYGEHYAPIRFKTSTGQRNTIQTVKITELIGSDEDCYLSGELVL
jgi:threonylcarbamoyladenosine tRNA methylthiotransferase MtaB